MARHMWLLVEWVDEELVFPSYGIVNVDTFSYKDSDLQPGNQIFLTLKNNKPRRAKVVRVSEYKRDLREHKDYLERQDQQVKNVMQLCMRTIKEMKSDQYTGSVESSLQISMSGHQSRLPHFVTAKSDNSASDSDTEVHHNLQPRQSRMTNYVNKIHHQNIRYEPSNHHKRGVQTPVTNPRRRSIMNSTPIPGKAVPENVTLYFDQGTQTENAWYQPPTSKIEEIELVLKHLYGRFQSLVMRVNNGTNRSIDIAEYEQNEDVYTEPNESWVVSNNVIGSVGIVNDIDDNNAMMCDVGAEETVQTDNQNEGVKIPVKIEVDRKNLSDSTRVRRMSAQTTFSNEMVPIGNGHAKVPARLLHDIDWSSHTTATRQLLQAIFPRKVLATHSLTGKQSPAHMNKPAKKLLDPKLVEDIILTVSNKSGVPKNLVRNTITVKCTDEAKLYRNRQRQFSRNEKNHENNENVPPTSMHSSDESSHILT